MGNEDYGYTCTHFALGSLILVGLATSELSGEATVVAVPLAAITVSLSAWCHLSVKKTSSTKKRGYGDTAEFLAIWLAVLEHLTAAATCARVASATVDYMSDGRLRDLLFGLESHSLGEPWPDVLGVSIIVVVTALFMLGLEKSPYFSGILYVGIFCSITFFLIVGGYHTDIKFWKWTVDFHVQNWTMVLRTSAMVAYGFVNTFPVVYSELRRPKCRLTVLFFIPLLIYMAITLVFTFMSHYRELAGTAIPLVRVFEVRDVDWARPVMAAFTICVVCISLTEIIPSLYNNLVLLAGKEWQVLVMPLLYKSSATGAPILAIFTAGSLVSILAFACPLSYLVRLLAVSTLLKCSLKSASTIYNCYKAEYAKEEGSVYRSNVHYSKLTDSAPRRILKKNPSRRLKLVLDMLPKYSRHGGPSNMSGHSTKSKKQNADMMEDKEYLLLDDYNATSNNEYRITTDVISDSDTNDVTPNYSDGEDSGSSTDIDVVVQEYKEKVQVATINNFTDQRSPTIITSRSVAILTFIIFVVSPLIFFSIAWKMLYLVWLSSIITLLSVVIILLMPQRNNPDVYTGIIKKSMVPFLSIVSMILNNILATTLLVQIWLGIILWTIAGLVIFIRCDVLTCDLICGKNFPKSPSCNTECSIPEIQQYRDKYTDTILIQR